MYRPERNKNDILKLIILIIFSFYQLRLTFTKRKKNAWKLYNSEFQDLTKWVNNLVVLTWEKREIYKFCLSSSSRLLSKILALQF